MSDENQDRKKAYKKSLNLPKTKFAMKANLVQREPECQKRWDKIDLYDKIRSSDHPQGKYVLHDGPPYANGPIHLGHLLNKVLKDLVVRSRTMMGFDVPFVPGWDCHGLPIEHKVMKDLGAKAKDMDRRKIRGLCAKDANKYIKLQSAQMKRLGTIAEYDDPYLTMSPRYEAGTLEVFADLVNRGLVYRDLKPVHWSIANQTALAEAELEYEDREDTSVFALFALENPEALPKHIMARMDQPLSLMIWTTTPWTLPANLAVAVSPGAEYGLYRFEANGMSGMTIVATEMADKVFGKLGGAWESLGECTGQELEDAGLKYRHPFLDKVCPVVTALYVTLEDGCGLVHTAPGHGVEDYQTGLKVGLDIYCPVLEDGTFDKTAPEWLQGKSVWEGNDLVIEQLREDGNLFLDEKFMHSYPHDWRSKTPVIFRATEQWFISVDKDMGGGEAMRGAGLRETAENVNFIPEWGRNRMRGMLESRPDWCISRQRAWGLPIPAFFGPEKGQFLLTEASVRAVADYIRQKGSDCWFHEEAGQILAGYDVAADAEAPDWLKSNPELKDSLTNGPDIFDVWFESGASWHSVARQRELGFPLDLYLEGSDQHRGWFQVSLLTALGATGQAPYNCVLTHGFMVDKDGKKMSKSGGNALNVDDLFKEYGADVCRWWVCGLNTDNDIKVDMEFVKLAGEEYRKVRNTLRFLLSNLNDFDPATDRRELTEADANSVDAWAMGELGGFVDHVLDAYEGLRFREVHNAIYKFCNETLSSVYLTATKDRLYCDAADSDRRRRTQTVLFDMADTLIRLVAPIMVHTADEAWASLYGLEQGHDQSVHVKHLPARLEGGADEGWVAVMALRDRVLKELEGARAEGGLDNPLDAGIEAGLTTADFAAVTPFAGELADLCGVSRFALAEGDAEAIKVVDLSEEPRCERSWKRDGTVAERSDGGMLTKRDAEAVGVVGV